MWYKAPMAHSNIPPVPLLGALFGHKHVERRQNVVERMARAEKKASADSVAGQVT